MKWKLGETKQVIKKKKRLRSVPKSLSLPHRAVSLRTVCAEVLSLPFAGLVTKLHVAIVTEHS